MTIAKVSFMGSPTPALLRVHYDIVRFPLQVIDRAAAAALGPASPLRLAYRDLLADLDHVVANVLGDESVEERARRLRNQTEAARQIVALSRQTLDAQLAAQGVLRMERYRQSRRRKIIDVELPSSKARKTGPNPSNEVIR